MASSHAGAQGLCPHPSHFKALSLAKTKEQMRAYKAEWARSHPDYARRHYEANKEKYKERAKSRHRRCRDAVNALLDERKKQGCVDCGYKEHLVALDFDHRDPLQKKFALSSRVTFQKSVEELVAEMDKCDVRCSNCHRVRTHAEKHWLYRGMRE